MTSIPKSKNSAVVDIKLRDLTKPTIKTLENTVDLGVRIRTATVRTVGRVRKQTEDGQASPSEYAGDQLQYAVEGAAEDAGDWIGSGGKGFHSAQTSIRKFRQKRMERLLQRRRKEAVSAEASLQTPSISDGDVPQDRAAEPSKAPPKYLRKTIRTAEKAPKTIKQSPRSAGSGSIKLADKTVKGTKKTIKTAEESSKVAIKTAQESAKAVQKGVVAAAKAAQKIVEASRATAKASAEAAKVAAKAVVVTVKAIIAATQQLIAALIAGGWVAVLIIVIVVLVALLSGSVFGIFFASEDTGSPMTMRQVVQELNTTYQSRLDTIRKSTVHDKVEATGARAVWPEVLAVYAVKVNYDPANPQEVASMDASKKAILEQIFWAMNYIHHYTSTSSETVIVERVDAAGNIIQVPTTQTLTTLHIQVSHKSMDAMADQYGFTAEQRQWLSELLQDENMSMWSAVLYGIYSADAQIVAVAASQIGNVGGQPYWSWYGFSSRVPWCACFVSWCANECGYIDLGIIPKFAGCINGVNWFRNRGQWIDGSSTPAPGMIIFFDWDDPDGEAGPQDGLSDHVGIVARVENGRVYTIEGNTGDSCKERSYPLGYYQILGYGIPAY